MATAVLVEEADLDGGIAMIYRRFGPRVRMAYNPAMIDEATALHLLGERIGAVTEVHHGA